MRKTLRIALRVQANLIGTAALTTLLALAPAVAHAQDAAATFQTRSARVQLDNKGFITSLKSLRSDKEYCPAGHPSSLLALHEGGQPNDKLLFPSAAVFNRTKNEIELKYGNGAVAVVKAEGKEQYFRFQLVSLTPRGSVDNIVWGPIHTTVSRIIGDLLGVVREEDWAIGLYGLDDNTIAGPVTDGDCYSMGYYIHSPDPVNYPVPPKYREGQWFNIGGDGVNDTAFFSHPEEYFQWIGGNAAKLEPAFGSTLAYHARDRRRRYTHLFSLLPGFARSRPRHQVSDPVDVDFIGSAVALYACPDDQGLATLEKIILAEGLPHVTMDGRWIRDPATFGPTLYWNGPHDQCLATAEALGVKSISRDTGEFYPSLANKWEAGKIGFATRPPMSFKAFTEEAHKHGLSHGGLHTMCLFLQGGISRDVTPVPSQHLQTVCRTKLAKDLAPTDTEVVVTEPSFLAEKGTWTWGDDSNYLRIDGEMLRYEGISTAAPWTLKGVKRGHASKPQAHQAGAEVVKLQQNCYNGFVPDMKLLLDYADYYAELMHRNGMDEINFDGFESTVYQNHGYYGTRLFCRRLFETYARLSGGKAPRLTSSNVFAGSWEFLTVCNVGGGDNMFNPRSGRLGIEGKDIRNAFGNSYFPASFGIQGWQSDWSVYDVENLQAKAVGWEATYALSTSQEVLDRSGEKDAMFKAFRTWQRARAGGVFGSEQKQKLRDPAYKFHLEQAGEKAFLLYPIKELKLSKQADKEATTLTVANPFDSQSLHLALQVFGPAVNEARLTLPDGAQIKSSQKLESGQFIFCNGKQAWVADKFRKKIADLPLDRTALLPAGKATIRVELPGAANPTQARLELTVWAAGKGEPLGSAKKADY
jgi:hypothetical protein